MSTTLDLEQVYREHRGHLYGYALRITGNSAMAEDAVQDAFLTAWVERDHWTAERTQPALSWLATLTRYAALSLTKTRGRTAISVGDLVDIWAEEDRSDTDLGLPCMADPDTAEAVTAALDQLPARQREAVRLYFLDGLSWREISTRMNASVNVVMCAAYRALRRLRSASAVTA